MRAIACRLCPRTHRKPRVNFMRSGMSSQLESSARRHLVALVPALPLALVGCAAGLEPTLAPKFAWPGPVDYLDVRFLFHSARFAEGYDSGVGRTEVGAPLLILDVTMTNTSAYPRAYEKRPWFQLRDFVGSIYESDIAHSMRINVGRPSGMAFTSAMNPNVPTKSEVVFVVPKKARYLVEVVVPNPYGSMGRFFRMDLSPTLGAPGG